MTDLSGIAGSEAEGVPGSGGSDGARSRGDEVTAQRHLCFVERSSSQPAPCSLKNLI